MMAAYSNTYAQKVYEIIAPLIGDMMAKGVIRSQAKVLGSNEDSLRKDDMSILAGKIGKGLVVFLGSDTALKIAKRIEQIQ